MSDTYTCPICFDNKTEYAYLGENHKCKICRNCIDTAAEKDPGCPMCRKNISEYVYNAGPINKHSTGTYKFNVINRALSAAYQKKFDDVLGMLEHIKYEIENLKNTKGENTISGLTKHDASAFEQVVDIIDGSKNETLTDKQFERINHILEDFLQRLEIQFPRN